jgi:hypothetical protein
MAFAGKSMREQRGEDHVSKAIMSFLAASVTLAVGCANASDNGCHRVARGEPAVYAAGPVERPTSSLLFDRVPGEALQPYGPVYTAQDFAYRSSWPSTAGYYEGHEYVTYRELYYDRQGNDNIDWNYLNRRFEFYKTGVAYR